MPVDEQSRRMLQYFNDFEQKPKVDVNKVCVRCPAAFLVAEGRKTGNPGVVCKVDGSFVDSVKSPIGFHTYCTGNYEKCPSWQEANKERNETFFKAFDPDKTKH